MTRNMLIAVLILIALAIFLGIRSMKDSYELLPIKASAKADTIPLFANWREYTAPDDKFKVKFPALPQNANQTVKDPKTQQLRNYDMYVSQKNDGTIFMVNLITFPTPLDQKQRDELMQNTIQDLTQANTENKLLEAKPDQFQNQKGLNFKIQSLDNIVQGKTFIVDKTLYVLMMVSKDSMHNPVDYDYFTHSFTIGNGGEKPAELLPSKAS